MAATIISRKQTIKIDEGRIKATVNYNNSDTLDGLPFSGVAGMKAIATIAAMLNGYYFVTSSQNVVRIRLTRFRVDVTGTVIIAGYEAVRTFPVTLNL